MLLVLMLIQLSASPVRADCADCAKRAGQFWGTVHNELSRTSPALASYLQHHEITHGRADAPVYFLSPDCGMAPSDLENVLNTAKQLKFRMTIFLMGRMIDRWPDAFRVVIQRAVAEGHELALHSYSHRSFVNMPSEQLYDEVVRNWALIDWALGYHYPIRFIRVPYGARNPTVLRELAQFGLQHVFWDIDSLGWRDYATVPIVHQQVTSKTRNGSIIIFHCSSAADRAALPWYVADLRAKGLEPQLLSAVYPRPTSTDLVGYPRPAPPERPAPAVNPVVIDERPEPPGLRRLLALLDSGEI